MKLHQMARTNRTDPTLLVDAIVVLRRRHDHPTIVPGMHLKRHEFEQSHGYHPHDHQAVLQFLTRHNLRVKDTNAPAKQLTIEGTVSDMEQAFHVELHDYHHAHQGIVRHHDEPTLPPELIAIVGLSTLKPIVKPRFAVNPPNTTALSVDTLRTLYNWPTNNASGQTIGLFQVAGLTTHVASDIATYFAGTGDVAPTVLTVVAPDVINNPTEANLDICAAGSAAPLATIAVYYGPTTLTGDRLITDTLTRMIHPWPNDPQLTVISISYGFFNDGSSTDLSNASLHFTLNSLFADAVAQGITVLASAGDNGSGLAQAEFGNASDGLAYVVEPSINPFVVSCGGTVVGNVVGNTFEEYVWNIENNVNATGGGVSQFYTTVPTYQSAIQPLHINTGNPGRGEPDITGNAASTSGLSIPINGVFTTIGGTSLTSPLYAGLIAVINAAMGRRAGYIHPILYTASNSTVFYDIDATTKGPPNNATGGAPGYPVKSGWDGSSGLGRPDGKLLLTAISNATAPRLALSYSDANGAAVPISGVGDTSFGFTHPPINTLGGTFINVFLTATPTITGVVNFSVTSPSAPSAVSNITAKGTANSISLKWAPPVPPGTPPYTYQIKWGNSATNLTNTGSAQTPVFTISNLAQSTTVFGTIAAIGPTNLVGATTTWSASTFNSTVAVTNIKVYVIFLSNYLTAVQWDDVGASGYFIDYSTSSGGPWRTTAQSPYPSGYGANNASSGGVPASYPHLTVNSVHGGHVNPATGICDVRQDYWVRIRALYSDNNSTTSAPFGPTSFAVGYPNVAGNHAGTCQSLGTGQLDVQWDDCYLGVSPQDGSALTYTVQLYTFPNGNQTLQQSYGPFTTGFGVNNQSIAGKLSGTFNHITGVPAGTYYIASLTSGGQGISGSAGLSEAFDGTTQISSGNATYPATTVT